MSDYIKREDAINAYNQRIVRYGLADFESVLNQVPAADVRENLRGQWCYDRLRNTHRCKLCGSPMYSVPSDFCEPLEFANFCWNCGADMRQYNEKQEYDDKMKIAEDFLKMIFDVANNKNKEEEEQHESNA